MALNKSNAYTLPLERVSTLTPILEELPSRILDCESECTLFAKGSGAGPINVTIGWSCELIDMVVHSQGTHASGTVQAKKGVGGTAITDAVIAAVANIESGCRRCARPSSACSSRRSRTDPFRERRS